MLLVVKKRTMFLCLSCLIISFICLCIVNSIFHKANSVSIKYEGNDKSKYVILIYIEDKRLYLIENNNCIKKYPIASGKADSPSPIGQWEIIEKSQWGKGFGGRWLGLNVQWGTYGIHGTTKEGSIGRALSHGCIRMYNKDIRELYDIVPIGTVVIIKNGSFGPFGTGFRELKPGDRGADVAAVQKRLKELGYYNGKETGVYEDDLKAALYRFQQDKKLVIKYTVTKPDYHAMGFTEFE